MLSVQTGARRIGWPLSVDRYAAESPDRQVSVRFHLKLVMPDLLHWLATYTN
jgi:hypothetical protein